MTIAELRKTIAKYTEKCDVDELKELLDALEDACCDVEDNIDELEAEEEAQREAAALYEAEQESHWFKGYANAMHREAIGIAI